MKFCIIGSSGHYGIVLDAMKLDDSLVCIGIAKGSDDEDISSLADYLSSIKSGTKVFDNYKEMLSLNPDIAVVNSHFNVNCKIAVYAIERGIAVFCEKPLAVTLTDFKKLENTIKSDSKLFSMLTIRYEPVFFTAVDLYKNGCIGQVRMVNVRKSYKLGDRASFYKKRETYGGTISWIGIHAIDLIDAICGETFRDVYAVQSAKDNFDNGDMEMTACAIYTLENEVIAEFTADYYRPASSGTHGDNRLRIVGTKGIIEAELGEVYLTNGTSKGREKINLISPAGIFQDFVNYVNGGNNCLLDTKTSLYTTKIAIMTQKCADMTTKNDRRANCILY